ncbi:hypothetical protein [Streptomyces sp. NPDC059786]|uniref:hypothetical protein n=1 Tax=Streptomyces sp. NPDC059786 TaxID=3346946 RepID=UPI00365B5539
MADAYGADARGGEPAGAAVDPLLAALTDEPLPEEVRDDAAFLAEHRSALADVALLREQLTVLADALTGPDSSDTAPEPESAPAPVRKRRRPGAFALALGGLVAAVAVSVVLGMGWLVARGGGVSEDSGAADKAAAGDSGSAKRSAEGYVACARLIVEGTVAAVEPVPGTARERVTLDVDRYLKPDGGGDEVGFVMDTDADPRPRVHDHVLIGIPRGATSPDLWATGDKAVARERARILAALPGSRTTDCG